MTDKQILKWLDQLQGELDALKKSAGGGGSHAAKIEELAHNTVYAEDITLSHAYTDYDMIVIQAKYSGPTAGNWVTTRCYLTDNLEADYNYSITTDSWYTHFKLTADPTVLDQHTSHEAFIEYVYGVKF